VRSLRPAVLWTAGALAFFLLATANAGGYRYGTSDQAFYIPAIRKAMDASLFPRDASLLDAQGRVIFWDGLVAGTSAATGLPLPWAFFLLYTAGVVALYAGGVLAGRAAGLGRCGTVALLAMLTLRHRIAKTGVNTLEGYLHPRMLAFALGVLALAAFMRRKPAWAAVALAAAAVLHPTTAVWFAMLIGAAAIVAWPRWRIALVIAALAGAAASIWAIAAGPLAPRAVVMDAPWLAAIASKDYLFPTGWPAYAWLFNLAPAAIAAVALARVRGLSAELRGLLWGALALTAFFLVTLPFVAMRYALAVQLQIPRVFWLVELMALIVIARAIASVQGATIGRWRKGKMSVGWALAAVLVAGSAVRGASVLFGEKDGRLISIGLPAGDWTAAMAWLGGQPADVHVLADPGHAWRYGSSVRVAAERDVFHEDVKDAAIAMYDRGVAMRVVERRARTADFSTMTVEQLHALAGEYDLDYLVTDQRLPLPIAYENAAFRIYALRP